MTLAIEVQGLPVKVISDHARKTFQTLEEAVVYLQEFFQEHKGPNESVLIRGSAEGAIAQFVGRIDGHITVIKMEKHEP